MLALPARLLLHVANLAFVLGLLVFGLVVLLPHATSWRTYTVLSGSMGPHIPTGALIFSSRVHTDQVRPGEVITYQAPINGLPVITHRVVSVHRNGDVIEIHTKGDANLGADPWKARMSAQSTLWHPRYVVPYAGGIMNAVRRSTPRPVMQLFVLVALLGGLAAIWRTGGKLHHYHDSHDFHDYHDFHDLLGSHGLHGLRGLHDLHDLHDIHESHDIDRAPDQSHHADNFPSRS